jgi:hypothetical protein
LCNGRSMTEATELADLLMTVSRTGAVCVLDLDRDGAVTLNADQVVQARSAFKIAVALEVSASAINMSASLGRWSSIGRQGLRRRIAPATSLSCGRRYRCSSAASAPISERFHNGTVFAPSVWVQSGFNVLDSTSHKPSDEVFTTVRCTSTV